MAMELGLGSSALHLLFLFPRQPDSGPGSGFTDWENPRLPHQLTVEKQESQRRRSKHSGKGCNSSSCRRVMLVNKCEQDKL